MSIDFDHYREICSHLGKFEAEGPETPYFYERLEHGEPVLAFGEDDDEWCLDMEIVEEATLFQADVEEMEVFDIGEWVLVWEDNQGFAYSQDFDGREEAEKFWEEHNA